MSETHPEQLSEQVIREIERLGGAIKRPPANKVTTISTVVGDTTLPEPMRQLLFDIHWPETVTYRSKDDDYPQGVEFGWTTVEENYGYDDFDGNLPYTNIAGDDSQFFYFIRLDDEDPSNPVVYRVDHEGQSSEPVGVKLASFLADLEPEG